jgi:hypothetical protein
MEDDMSTWEEGATVSSYPYMVAGVGYHRFVEAERAAARRSTFILYRHRQDNGLVVYVSVPGGER